MIVIADIKSNLISFHTLLSPPHTFTIHHIHTKTILNCINFYEIVLFLNSVYKMKINEPFFFVYFRYITCDLSVYSRGVCVV